MSYSLRKAFDIDWEMSSAYDTAALNRLSHRFNHEQKMGDEKWSYEFFSHELEI
jgi:hypothetical protein